jgi:hypothetical protein
LGRRSAQLPQLKNCLKAMQFSSAGDANKIALPLARKVCEIFHVFAHANGLDNFQAQFTVTLVAA